MKIILLLLPFLLLSCMNEHKDEPKLVSLEVEQSSILWDSISSKVFTNDTTELDSLKVTFSVIATNEYTIRVGDVKRAIILDSGNHDIVFNWKDIPQTSDLVVSAGDERFPNEISYDDIAVNWLVFDSSFKTKITIEKSTYLYDSIGSNVYSEAMVSNDSLKLRIASGVEKTYQIAVGTVTKTVNLKSGMSNVLFGWDQIELSDTLIATIWDPRFPYEVDTAYSVIKRYDVVNDPYLKFAWHLQKSDPEYAKDWNIHIESHINVADLWNSVRGRGVKVAVIDSDFDITHEDLMGNVINTYDIQTQGPIVGNWNKTSHGSTVAGAIAAVADNGIGISGVAPEAELILIKDSALSSDANVIRAFQYAREQGAQIINCSWGSYDVSDAVVAVLKELYEDGIIVVFATGNRGYDLEYFNDESELPWVIGVGVSTEQNDRWKGADYGEALDVIAPGAGELGFLGIDNMGADGSTRQFNVVDNNYGFVKGASFSAPTVAGVIALMLEVNPMLSPSEVRYLLIKNADKVGGDAAEYNQYGFDKYRAYGKVNAGRAVEAARY